MFGKTDFTPLILALAIIKHCPYRSLRILGCHGDPFSRLGAEDPCILQPDRTFTAYGTMSAIVNAIGHVYH